MNFYEKSALVLGGTGGIGKAVVENLAKSSVKKLGVIDILEKENGNQVLSELLKDFPSVEIVYKQASVEDEKKLKKVMEKIASKLGGLDIVVNSVGILKENDPKSMIMINFYGTVNSTLNAIDIMRKDRGGRGGYVLNISSVSGTIPVFPLQCYGATKHAIIGYTRALAESDAFFERTGIHFIPILPGVTGTQLIETKNLVGNFIFPEMKDEVISRAGTSGFQEADWVGKCVIAALTQGKNGDVWQVENRVYGKIEINHRVRLE